MSQIPKLTFTLSRDTVNHTGFTVYKKANALADPEPIALLEPVDGDGSLQFTTSYIYENELVYWSYAPGDVVGATDAVPMEAISDQPVVNNSTVPNPGPPAGPTVVTGTSTITLTSTDPANTYDGFRVYVDDQTLGNHVYEGKPLSGEITFADLSPQPSIGVHTLYIKTYNALGESLASVPVDFEMT